MIEIRKMSIDSDDAKELIQELNQALTKITGDDGTVHFKKTDVEEDRSVFLIGYIDDKPYACGALRKITETCGEIKRVYARKNTEGMGHRIVEALEEEAKELAYDTLLLETRVQNEHAIAFYDKNGYTHCSNYGVYVGSDHSYCLKKKIEQIAIV